MAIRRCACVAFAALAAALLYAPAAFASGPWMINNATASGGGPGQTLDAQLVSDGTTAPAKFRYDYVDSAPADSGNGANASGSFDVFTTADADGPVTLDWHYEGFHAFFAVRVTLTAYVESDSDFTYYPLVNAGPANCCTEPSGGFRYSGRLVLPDVRDGDHYGFVMTGSNGDSNATLQGTLGLAWVVDRTDDSSGGVCDTDVANDCSLRSAIEKANASPYEDRIVFNIPAVGTQTISPTSALPQITGPTDIDATTQPGFVGLPLVELDGSAAGSVHGFDIEASQSTIRGFAINGFTSFPHAGVYVANGATGNTIAGNYIGTNAAGTLPDANWRGVEVDGQNNTIGGDQPADRNVISGNTFDGVEFGGNALGTATGNVVQGNYLGTNAAGSGAIANGFSGVSSNGLISDIFVRGNLASGNVGSGIRVGPNSLVEGNRVGTDAAGTSAIPNSAGVTVFGANTLVSSNFISGNSGAGIVVFGDGAEIRNNYIGTDAAGTDPLGNGTGVMITSADNTHIGGTCGGCRNVISGNSGIGILANGGTGLQVQGNYIGVDATGNSPLGNLVGINIRSTRNSLVGGTAAGAGNVVSANKDGIYIESDDGSVVQGNIVGLAADGTTNLGNRRDPCPPSACLGTGITVDQELLPEAGTPPLIGGTTPEARNIVARNDQGILLLDAPATIQGNWIGLDKNGDPAGNGTVVSSSVNGGIGIKVAFATGAQIGGTSDTARNVVSSNLRHGIELEGATDTSIQGNYIGTDTGGAGQNGNRGGIFLSSGTTGTLIGGAATAGQAPGNVIAGNSYETLNLSVGNTLWAGVAMTGVGTTNNVLRGNLIGVAADGTTELINAGDGVLIADGAADNVVGNNTGSGSDRNVIANNVNECDCANVHISGDGADGNHVVGNRIGTADGVDPGNNFLGVLIDGGANGNVVGGAQPGRGNLLSGNQSSGVTITGEGTSFNAVVGNRIGIKADGSGALSNGNGVEIDSGATRNDVGGTPTALAPSPGNLIAGNDAAGVLLVGTGTEDNRVKGNTIGQAADAESEVPEVVNDVGIKVADHASHNTIGLEGEDGPGAANTITDNTSQNIKLINGADSNNIVGNQILNSLGQGIFITSGGYPYETSDGNHINVNEIRDNGSSATGVAIEDGTENSLRGNSIHDNLGLGIDLGDDGFTPNDYAADCDNGNDCDTGANNLQNFPVVTSAQISGSDLTVDGTLDTTPFNPGTPYTIEVFSQAACDAGHGEGENFLGTATATVDNNGHATWTLTDSGTDVSIGDAITTTATDSDGNTSEFSACQTVTSSASASLTFGTTSPAVNAGAQTVPIGGIDRSALTQGNGTTSGTALGGIPLEKVALGGIALGGIALGGIGLTPALLNSAFGGVHLADITLSRQGGWPQLLQGTPALANVPLDTLTLADVPASVTNTIQIRELDLSRTALGGIALGGIGLGPLLLSQVPLDASGPNDAAENLADWCTAIDALPDFACTSPGTTLANETIMSEVVRGLPLDAIGLDGAPLGGTAANGAPVAGVALGGIALGGIALGGINLNGTALGGIALGGINMQSTALGGIALGGIDIQGSALGGIALGGIALGGIPLSGPQASALGGIALGGISTASQIVDCSGGYCANHTLGQAAADNRLLPTATLGLLVRGMTAAQQNGFSLKDLHGYGNVTLAQLVAALTNTNLTLRDLVNSLPPGFTLHDLFAVIMGGASYDWGALNLGTFPLADYSTDGGVITYQANFTVNGGLGTHAVTLRATLPTGGRYVGNSATIQLGANPKAPVTTNLTGNLLTFTANVLTGQAYTIEWRVRAGLDLGSFPANVSLSASGLANAALAQTSVLVGQTFDSTPATQPDDNNDPATAPVLAGGRLYVSHLTKGDTDYYRIPIGLFGSRVQLTLSHIAANSDYDLTVGGPQAPRLRGAALGGIPLMNTQLPDTSINLNQAAQPLPPETLQDVPSNALTANGNVIRGVSDNRGKADEHITLISEGESGYYTVQVSDFAGDSPTPYVLEIETSPSPDLGPCTQRSLTNGAPAAPPAVSANTNTLFLVDQARMNTTFGTTLTMTMMNKLTSLAGRTDLGINGAVVRVENGPGVANAYGLWDQVPCSPQRANDVVKAIGQYLDTLQASAPNVQYIVLVGGDDIVPFARVPDETQIANEQGYRDSLPTTNNEYLGSFGAGFLLTDDVYSEKGAPQFLGHELFVPELATGRLVESPTDIGKTIDNFTGASGALSPTSSLVTGYDFLTDGAQSINVPFAAGFGTQAKTLISETWDRGALLAALFPAGAAPTLNSLNAHFDHQRLLPAAENAANRQLNLVATTDITSRGPNIMAGRLGFSIGCHSGLAVSDAVFGAANILRAADWAQTMLGTGSPGWVGNTGYGLGDTTEVAYSERLHALFARKLDGSLTLGQALGLAKQDYIGTLGVITNYDAKVVMEATLYGLPMLRLGAGIPPVAPPPLPTHTDPATNLQAASFDVSPTFTPVTTPAGKYYRADDGVQATPRRPLEPLYSIDVTEPGAAVAHGALIRILDSPVDESPFNAIFSRVTTDKSADEFDLVGVTAFPSKIQNISTFTGFTGQRQRLNLIVGLFRSNGATLEGIGTHRRFTRVAGDILYSTSADWTPPNLGALEALQIGSGIGFGVDVTDQTQTGAAGVVKAVIVLYRDCAGTWRTSNLALSSGNRWSGGGAIAANCNNIDYYLEAVDAAGNVAVASRKIQLQPIVLPFSSPSITGTTASAAGQANGWYKGTVTVTLTSSDPVQYSLDGAPFQTYGSPFAVTVEGLHKVEAKTPSGATSYVAFGIDKTTPTIVVNTPAEGAVYALNQQVRADFACTDAGSGVVSGCAGTVANGALLNTSTLGAKTFTVSAATDAVGNTAAAKTVNYTIGYRKVLFASTRTGNGDIYSMNLDGTGVNQLTSNSAIDIAPTYSPDGRRVLFTTTRTGNGDIYAMNPDGTGVSRLTSSNGIEALGDYSPDGKKIVFTSTKDGNVEIYVMNADGTAQTRLTTNPAIDADPVFSPDGTKIAFATTRDGSSNFEIYTINANGTSPTRLTNSAGLDGEPAWSSTNKIAFTSARNGNNEIYVMNANGTSPTRLTNNSGSDTTPAWSVDGTQILFSSDRSGSAGFDVYSMTAAGASQTRRTTNAAFDGTPAW